jgi:DNA processing protein
LQVLGHAHLQAGCSITVVGARNASAAGRRFAREIAAQFGNAGLIVVSGMARGIDGAAHEGALATGTVVALAGGVDVVYPKKHDTLYRQIVEGGAVFSELPPSTRPTARHFPPRNRLVSGLSLGALMVEAAPKSGSLITARMALEQDREVFAVPGSPLDPRYRGTNGLIRQGAVLTESTGDIIEVLSAMTRQSLAEPKSPKIEAPAVPKPDPAALGEARTDVTKILSPVPVTVDELLRECQLSPALVHTVLLELELAGRLERSPGNRVSLLPLTI